MTDQPRCLAVVEDYDGLHTAIRAWVDEQQVTREAIDAVSGLQSGYSGKLLAPVPSKTFGRISLGLMLGALGLDLWVMVNTQKLAAVQGRLSKRKRVVVPGSKPLSTEASNNLSPEYFRKMGALGGQYRSAMMTKIRRRQIASSGGSARWRKGRKNRSVGS